MTKIIGITGLKRAGKNSVGKILLSHIDGVVMSFAYADPIKLVVSMCFPALDHLDKEEPCAAYGGLTQRQACQTLGTEWGRSLYTNVWIDKLNRDIAKWAPDVAIITDVRFPNEVADIKRQGGSIWKVDRPKVAQMHNDTHASEKYIGDIQHDVLVRNVGTLDDLEKEVLRLYHL